MVMVAGEPVERWRCNYQVCQAACCRIERGLTLLDIKEIVKATRKAPQEFVTLSTVEGPSLPLVLKRRGGGCIFLEQDHGCALHNTGAKPLLCRMYPFLLSRIIPADEPMMVITPAADCPGYGTGPVLEKSFMNEIRRYGRLYVNELRRILRYRNQGVEPKEILRRELQT